LRDSGLRTAVKQDTNKVSFVSGPGEAEPIPSTIRVARVIDRLNIGGPAKHVVWLTDGLSEAQFQTTLITGVVPSGEGDMSYFARERDLEPIVIEEMSRELSPRDILVVAKLLRQFLKLKPQIIHTHKAKAGAVGRVAGMIYKWLTPSALLLKPRQCRVVHTYHGHVFHSYYGPLKTRLFVLIERLLARTCTDRIIVVSEQQCNEISNSFRIGRPQQFRIVPLGLDLDELSEVGGQLRRERGISDDEVTVGIVGRLCEVKNHTMLLESAASLINMQGGDEALLRLVIVGDGHLRAEIERKADELGVADNILFTGFREDAIALYADFDIVALTSLNEGTPLTLIEAMGCGRPIASTEVGGVVDVMGERKASQDGFSIWDHGVTAPSRDAGAFARALRFLIERPALRRQMGERGRSFVQANLSRVRLISDIESIYRSLVSESDPAATLSPAAQLAAFRGRGNSL